MGTTGKERKEFNITLMYRECGALASISYIDKDGDVMNESKPHARILTNYEFDLLISEIDRIIITTIETLDSLTK